MCLSNIKILGKIKEGTGRYLPNGKTKIFNREVKRENNTPLVKPALLE